jgi:geranylgeranyl diphosphate synthase type II
MMTPEQRYERHKALIERYLREFLTERKPHTLYHPAKYVLGAGGKRIRPVLVLLACEAVGGEAADALPAGVGVEVLHNFTLVHDDIMDHAASRRGRPTIHKKWDENVAILVGDALLALAYRALLRTKSARIQEISRVFTEAVVTVCEGQAYDKEFETRHRVHVNEYLLMIEKKTGKLVSVAMHLGALIGNANQTEICSMLSPTKRSWANRSAAIWSKARRRSSCSKRCVVRKAPRKNCFNASLPKAEFPGAR